MSRRTRVTAAEARNIAATWRRARDRTKNDAQADRLVARSSGRSASTIRAARMGRYLGGSALPTIRAGFVIMPIPLTGPVSTHYAPALGSRERIEYVERLSGSIQVIDWSRDSVSVEAIGPGSYSGRLRITIT